MDMKDITKEYDNDEMRYGQPIDQYPCRILSQIWKIKD
jgi:hypothetical protein